MDCVGRIPQTHSYYPSPRLEPGHTVRSLAVLSKGPLGLGHGVMSPVGASLLGENVYGVIGVLRETSLSRPHQHLVFLLQDGTALLQLSQGPQQLQIRPVPKAYVELGLV